MAGQWRHGAYEDFDPSKMVTAEIAIVTSGDPNAVNGRSIYVCFSPGVVKRFATYEDFIEEISNATADIRDQFTGDIDKKIMEAEAAVLGANSAASAAEKAKEMANTAAEAANEAAKKAEAAAGGEISEKTVTFQEAVERANIESGDTLAVAFAKLARYCADLKVHAFFTPVADLLSDRADLALSASMGKELKRGLDELNTNTGDRAALGPKIKSGAASYRIIGKMCFVTLEATPSSALAQGDIIISGVPAPLEEFYLTVGNYTAYMKMAGTVIAYYPGYTGTGRIDACFCYPVG